MAKVTITATKLEQKTFGAVTFTAGSTDGVKIPMSGKDNKIVILVQNSGSSAATVKVKAGNGLQGISDSEVYSVAAGGLAVVLFYLRRRRHGAAEIAPPLSEAEIMRERLALDEAVARIEADHEEAPTALPAGEGPVIRPADPAPPPARPPEPKQQPEFAPLPPAAGQDEGEPGPELGLLQQVQDLPLGRRCIRPWR